MASQESRIPSTPCLLDRLTDSEPGVKTEPALRLSELNSQLKHALCRDLAALLNTRRAEEDFDPAYRESTHSVLTFGVADFTSSNLTNEIDRSRLRLSIERAIRQFETRLTGVTVTMEEPDLIRPTLTFQVTAMLRTGTASGPMLFDITVHRDSRRVAVAGATS